MTTTTSPRAALTPVIEPHTQRWLDELAASAGSPPLWELSPEDARQLLRYVQASVPVRLQPADIDDRIIPGGLTGQVSIRIIRPAGAAGVPLVIFHFHGGGWVLGDKDTNERLDRELANAARAVVVFVDYTPAPDAQYPVQNEQACTAMQWAIANAGGIGADPARVALVGDSAGGNVTAALTFMAKERGGPQIAAQVLSYPVTDANLDTGTYQRYADGPWATRKAMRWFWDSYLPDRARRAEITASPLQASVDQLRGLPPGPDHQRRARRAPRRGRGLRAQALPGRRARDRGPLRRHDPRLRPAQPDRRHPRAAGSHSAGRQLPAQRPDLLTTTHVKGEPR
jgi:acetyl esterase